MEFFKRVGKLYFSRGFWISGPQFFSIAVQLITLPIVLRAIPQDRYGSFTFALSVAAWVVLLSVGNLTLGSKRGIATDAQGTFLFAFLYRLRIIFPLGILLALCGYFIDPDRGIIQQLVMIAGAYVAIGYLPQVSFPQYFIARQQFKNHFVWQCVLYVLSPVLAAYAAVMSGDILVFAAVYFGCISVVSVAAMLWILLRNSVIASYKKGEIDYQVVRYGFSLIPAEIVTGTSGQLSSFIIGPFFGFVDLAVYAVAGRVEAAVRNFLASFNSVVYADFARKDFDALRALLREKRSALFLGSVGLSLLVAVPGFVYILYAIPDSYSQAAELFVLFAVGFPAIFLRTILDTFLASHLRHRALVFTGVVPNLIKIALIIVLGFMGGIVGIAIAVTLSAWIGYAFYYAAVFHKGVLLSLIPSRFRKDALEKSEDEKQADAQEVIDVGKRS